MLPTTFAVMQVELRDAVRLRGMRLCFAFVHAGLEQSLCLVTVVLFELWRSRKISLMVSGTA